MTRAFYDALELVGFFRPAGKKPKIPSASTNKRTAAKSQRVQRIERGMRPRVAVGARKTERRARHAVVGAPK